MKLGIVGSGMIVGDLFSFIGSIPQIEITALCGRAESKEKLGRLQQEQGIPKLYFAYERMCEDVEVDTVYVALPNHLHFAYSKIALEKGKHVICEKPFTTTAGELEELIQTAGNNHVYLLEAISNQYQSVYLEVKRQLARIGEVKIAELNFSQYSSRYDRFRQGEMFPAFDRKQAGGALMDINIYNIHIAVGLFGKPEAARYYANVERDIDTSGILLMRYQGFPCVCIGAKDSFADCFTAIQGDRGTIRINGAPNACPSCTIAVRGEETVEYLGVQPVHRMYEEFVRFEEMIRNRDTVSVSAMLAHSKLVMEVIDEISRGTKAQLD